MELVLRIAQVIVPVFLIVAGWFRSVFPQVNGDLTARISKANHQDFLTSKWLAIFIA